MTFNLDSITKTKRRRAPRIILLGVEKIGKSFLAAGAPNPIFIPVAREEGIDDLEVASFPVVDRYEDALACIKALYSEDHDFQTVVLDSASAIEPLVWKRVCARSDNAESIERVGGGYGKGYTEALTEWNVLMSGLDALREKRNMTTIIIGHVTVRRFDDPTGLSYDQYTMDVHQKAANRLFRWADCILFINTKVVVKKEDAGFGKELQKGKDVTGGARFLYTQKRPAHPGGGRGVYGQLPYEIKLPVTKDPREAWGAFVVAITKALTEGGGAQE